VTGEAGRAEAKSWCRERGCGSWEAASPLPTS